jgi:hypothetical protein
VAFLRDLIVQQAEKKMLFPTFSRLGQRLKRLLATDVTAIWQVLLEALEEEPESTREGFHDGYLYHPPI